MAIEIKGRVNRVNATEQKSEKFQARTIWIDTDGKYPQIIEVRATGDRCAALDGFAVGEEVTAWIDLRGRKWTDRNGTDKVFNELSLWKIERTGAAQHAPSQSAPQDDIPF